MKEKHYKELTDRMNRVMNDLDFIIYTLNENNTAIRLAEMAEKLDKIIKKLEDK